MSETVLSKISGVAAGYNEKPVFRNLDMTIRRGGITVFCGPNGSGKSTALKLMRRLLKPDFGQITLVDRPLEAWGTAELARELALLSQHPQAPEDITLSDLVMLGRFAHRRALRKTTSRDREAIEKALAFTDLGDLRNRTLGSLSGGQRQRAWIAMVLAQDAPTILLDEPTNHLDLGHALETMALLQRLNKEDGRTIIAVLHDLNLAARFADHVYLFNKGAIAAEGSVPQVLTRQHISRIYKVDCDILQDPRSQRPVIVAHPRTC